jgi:hypothetical protein
MRRIVIDTNVFVAAGFNPKSAAARILAGVREGHFQLIWNEPTRQETEITCAKFRPSTGRESLICSSPKRSFLAPSILRDSPLSRIQRIENSQR